MVHSERLISLLIIIFVLVITAHILLLLSNNKPLFAERRVLVHERSRTLNLITAFQNTESNKTIGVQRNSFLSSITIKNMIGNNSVSPPTLKSNNNSTHNYRTPRNSGQLATLQESNHIIGEVRNEVQIALVEPTFTAAAYNNSFYAFYQKYNHVPANANITSDLNLLSSKVSTYPTITPTTKVHSAFAMLTLLVDLKLISPRSNVTVLTDADVDNASIFKNNNNNNNGVSSIAGNIFSTNNAYDVIIIGHQEYVTQREYDNLKNFVTNGGTMIVLDGNVFYAEVKYDRHTNTITLVKGHSWAFNGRSAWKSVAERWNKETSQWVGSNYLCYSCQITFANDPFEYKHHEEQYITNPNDKILMNYNASLLNYPTTSLKKPVIATYELDYKGGKVISLGIYSDDIITNDKFDRYFNGLFLQYALKSRE